MACKIKKTLRRKKLRSLKFCISMWKTIPKFQIYQFFSPQVFDFSTCAYFFMLSFTRSQFKESQCSWMNLNCFKFLSIPSGIGLYFSGANPTKLCISSFSSFFKLKCLLEKNLYTKKWPTLIAKTEKLWVYNEKSLIQSVSWIWES